MVFSSLSFVLVFLPVFFLLYFSVYKFYKFSNRIVFLNLIIFLFSLLFYAWGEPVYVFLLLFSVVLNYILGHLIYLYRDRSHVILFLGISVNIFLLFHFKYFNFFLKSLCFPLIRTCYPNFNTLEFDYSVSLPLGISFFTFQAVSYLLDIYRNQVKPSDSLISYGCYLTMFSQLVAGPIVRYEHIEIELRKRTISSDSLTSGIKRFIRGLSKKVLIADSCGRVVDAAFSIPNDEVSSLVAYAGMICYTIQIYFDFSGYSDMAIGLGRMFGFSFPENFNYPYISKSITEFWRRWHISLSTWFKDYLYIPLGGNRCSILLNCRNLFIVFSLCGFWHGAEWVFLFWGIYHAVFVITERLFKSFFTKIPTILSHFYTVFVVMVGWLLFRSNDLNQFIAFIKGCLGINCITNQTYKVMIVLFSFDTYIAIFLGIIFSCPIYRIINNYFRSVKYNWSFVYKCILPFNYLAYILILLLCFCPLYGATYNAFIYFRF